MPDTPRSTEIELSDEEREALLKAWPWPLEAATTRTGFGVVVAAVQGIIRERLTASIIDVPPFAGPITSIERDGETEAVRVAQELVYRDAASEVHKEARWTHEMTMRGTPPDPLDRLLMVEKILTDRADAIAAGEAPFTALPTPRMSSEWPDDHRPIFQRQGDTHGYWCSCGYASCDLDGHVAHVADLLAGPEAGDDRG